MHGAPDALGFLDSIIFSAAISPVARLQRGQGKATCSLLWTFVLLKEDGKLQSELFRMGDETLKNN